MRNIEDLKITCESPLIEMGADYQMEAIRKEAIKWRKDSISARDKYWKNKELKESYYFNGKIAFINEFFKLWELKDNELLKTKNSKERDKMTSQGFKKLIDKFTNFLFHASIKSFINCSIFFGGGYSQKEIMPLSIHILPAYL